MWDGFSWICALYVAGSHLAIPTQEIIFPLLNLPAAPLVAGFFMRGRMGGMTPTTKAELLAALADNSLQIQDTAARIVGRINHAEWHLALDRIVELRKVQKELEGQLMALQNNPPSVH
jgi:hypothetical protein